MFNPDTMPLSIAHLSELDTPPLDYIEFAARAGFASIGLRPNPAAPGGIVYPLATATEQAELRRPIKATGVSVMYIELIGLSEALAGLFIQPSAKSMFCFGLLILVLLFRPQGLMGRKA